MTDVTIQISHILLVPWWHVSLFLDIGIWNNKLDIVDIGVKVKSENWQISLLSLQLWITRIAAASRQHGMKYPVLMHNLAKVSGVKCGTEPPTVWNCNMFSIFCPPQNRAVYSSTDGSSATWPSQNLSHSFHWLIWLVLGNRKVFRQRWATARSPQGSSPALSCSIKGHHALGDFHFSSSLNVFWTEQSKTSVPYCAGPGLENKCFAKMSLFFFFFFFNWSRYQPNLHCKNSCHFLLSRHFTNRFTSCGSKAPLLDPSVCWLLFYRWTSHFYLTDT